MTAERLIRRTSNAAIERSKSAAARGEFATDADAHRVWAKHRV